MSGASRSVSGDLVLTSAHAIDASELRVSFARSSGPGGQNVNKVETKAILRWEPAASASLSEAVKSRVVRSLATRLTKSGELVLECDRHRLQSRNLAEVRDRLRALVREAMIPPTPRRPTKPTRGSKERRLKQKREQSERKSLRKRPSL